MKEPLHILLEFSQATVTHYHVRYDYELQVSDAVQYLLWVRINTNT